MVGQTWSGPVNPLWHQMVYTWNREQKIDLAVRRRIGKIDRLDGMCDIEIVEALWSLPEFKRFRDRHIQEVRAEFRRIEAQAP